MKLSVLKKSQSIQEIDLGKDVFAQDYSETIFLIGRSKDCHIVLDDKKISREHLKIIHKSGKWYVEKTQQGNAAQINGEDFDRRELENDDAITVEMFSINVRPKDQNENVQPTIQEKVVYVQPVTSKAAPPIEEIITAPEESSKSKNNSTSTDLNIQAIRNDFDDSTKEIHVGEFKNESINEPGESSMSADYSLDNDSSLASNENISDANFEAAADDVQFSDEPNDEIISMADGGDAAANYSLENIDNSSDDESTKIIQSFANVHLELFGDTAPYDKYILDKEKAYIGRDPAKCQIVLNDSEVSTVHAVITKNNIMISLEDLNSSNGTIYKGDRINKVILNHNDEFVIGGVTFTLKIRSEFLKGESSTLMAVDENQTVEVEEVVEVQAEEGEQLDALGEMVENAPPEKSIIKRILKNEEQRKKVIYGLVILVGAWFMFEEDTPPAPAVNTTKSSKATKKKKAAPVVTGQVKLSDEQRQALSAYYEIGKDHYNNGRYREALVELQKVSAVDPQFNSSLQSLIALSKEGLSKIEEQEKEREAALAAAARKIKVKELMGKAREYTKERQVELAQNVFNEVMQLEPENLEVPKLKRELETWQKEKERVELEVIEKKRAREAKVEKLKPGKQLYLQKEWFKAISKLEEFLKAKDMDEDLTAEATEMLKVSREELSSAVSPLIGKAKSLMEGQDLKGAYEVYQQILRIEPSNTEALNQMGDIKEQLSNRARKIYREAIISESLTLFQDAKEKFQEVQQVSPVDSEYYKKATDKLRDYLD